ncbi:vWA domain-containing protein [Nonomuraea wenchangensis]|uniref:vWA domain-containing protein n=1 Tax=Nonomuraea wenchangensis TaxID=568860 RepID=UPI00341B15B6
MTSITSARPGRDTAPGRWRHIELVIDRSDSMSAIRTQTEAGVHAFLAEQRQVPGRTTVSLTMFAHDVELMFANHELAQVPEIRLAPRGQTALLDAIGQTLTQARRFVRGRPRPERPDEIIVVVVTDGYDNASRRFTSDEVRALIHHLHGKKRTWQVVLVGATAGVELLAESLGVPVSAAIRYDHALSETALTVAGQMLRRASETGRLGFTEDERAATRH